MSSGKATTLGVVAKVGTILRLYQQGPPAKRLVDLKANTSLSLTTTHRTVRDMVSQGLLERDEDGRYLLGPLVRSLNNVVALSEHRQS